MFRSTGRFTSLEQVLKEFENARSRIIRFVREEGEFHTAVRLADGHARRHADQIREICEELENSRGVDMKPGRLRKASAFRRDAPDLPGDFEMAEESGRLFAEGGSVAIQEQRFCDLERANSRMSEMRIE